MKRPTDELEKSNDKEFIIWLYMEYKELMYSTAYRYVDTQQMAEDIVQDSLVKLIRKTDTLRTLAGPALGGYIVSTIRNTAINVLKSKNREALHVTSLSEDFAVDPLSEPSLDAMMIASESNRRLADIWPDLTWSEQLLLEGKYFLGFTDQELARQLKCKASSIRMKLTRARRKAMALLLEEEGDDDGKA